MEVLNLQGRLTLDTSEYEAAIQRAVTMGGQLSGNLQGAAGSTTQMQAGLANVGQSAQQTGEQLTQAGEAAGELGQSADNAGQQAAQLRQGLGNTNSTANEFANTIKNAVSVALGNIFTQAITKAKDALVGFAKQSISAGMNFDSAMSQVAATMGVTADQVADLRDFAKDMGANTAFSASQAAEALNYMALAGYDAEKSMSMLPNVLNLAAAGGMSLGNASDMVTDAQSALGLTMEETTELVNKMAMTASKSNTSVSQLGEAILQIGGTAKKLAGGTTELATDLGILADNGMKGAEGGTHLRNMLNSLMSPTKDARAMMEEYGISLYDAEGNMRSLNDVFLDMRQVISEMTTQEERDKIVTTLFNARDMKAAEALLAGVGDRYQELSGYIDDAAESAQNMADTQLDNLQGDMTLFRSAVEGAQIAVSERLTPELRNLTKFGSKAVSEMSEGFRDNGLKGAIEGAHTAINTAFSPETANKIYAAKDAVIAFTAAFAAFKGLSIISSVTTTIAGVESLSAAMAALNINPLIAAGTAAIAAAAAFKSYVDNIDVTDAVHEIELFNEEEKELIETAKEIKALSAEQTQSARDTAASFEIQERSTSGLVNQLFKLDEAESKDAKSKAEMQAMVELLNNSVNGLNLEYDEQTGKLSKTREEVEKLTNAYFEQAKQQSYIDGMTKAIEGQNKAELELGKAQKKLAEKKDEREHLKNLREVEHSLERQREQYEKLIDQEGNRPIWELGTARENIEKYRKKIAEIDGQLNSLHSTYGDLDDAVIKASREQNELASAVRNAQSAYDEFGEDVEWYKEQYTESGGAVKDAAEEMSAGILAIKNAAESSADTLTHSMGIYKDEADGTIKVYAQVKNQIRKFTEEQITDIAKLVDAYDEAYDAQYKAISSTVDLYKGFTADTSTTYDDMLTNLKQSAFYLDDWTTAIDQLQAKVDKGLMSQDFLDSLKGMGLDSWSIVYDMNHATGSQLKEYSDLWDKTNNGIKESTDKLMAGQKETTEKELENITGIAEAKIGNYRHSFELLGVNIGAGLEKGITDSIKDVKKSTDDLGQASIGQMEDTLDEHSPSKEFQRIGEYAVKGFAVGMYGKQAVAENAARNIARATLEAMRDELDINSPSKVMQKLGAFTGQGFALGMESTENDVLNAADMLAQSAQDPLNGISAAPVQTGGAGFTGGTDSGTAGEQQPTNIILNVDGRAFAEVIFPYFNEILGRTTNMSIRGYAGT